MANAFDRFDSSASGSQSAGNPFDAFDAPQDQPMPMGLRETDRSQPARIEGAPVQSMEPAKLGLDMPAKEPESGSILQDAAGLYGMGSGSLLQGAGWLFNSDELTRLGTSTKDYWQKKLSPEQVAANNKSFVNDAWSMGEGATDIRTYFGLAVQSLPMMVPGMGAAGLTAKAATAMGAGTKLAAGLAAAAGSAGEGVTIGAMVGQEVDQTIRGMSEADKMQSPYYSDLRKLYGEEEATSRLSTMAANPAALKAGTVGAALGYVFNKFLGDALTGRLSGGPVREGTKGLVIEGGTETLQSGFESDARQNALEKYAAQEYSYTDLVNEMVTGLAAGSTMGASVGALGGLSGSPSATTEAGGDADTTVPPIIQDEVQGEADGPVPPTVQPEPPTGDNAPTNDQFGRPDWATDQTDVFRDGVTPTATVGGNPFDVFDQSPPAAPEVAQAEPTQEQTADPAPGALTEIGTGVFRVPVDQINVDPEQYQFRSNMNEKGVDKRLDGVEKWDDGRANNILLHRKKDGSLFVADGHHRLDLAKRLGQTELNATIVDESDGISVEGARVEAAMNNISDGKAVPVDVAKVFRDSGIPATKVRDTFNLPSSQVVRDGEAISKLSDNVFGMVASGQMSEKDGAAIGATFTEQSQQEAAASAFQKIEPQTDYQRNLLINEIRAADFAQSQGDQGGLFGEDTQEISLMQDRLKVLDTLRQQLNSDKRLFKSLNDNADRATGAGNTIATEANATITESSAKSLDLISRVTTTPALNEMVNRAARRVFDGEARATVAKELKQELSSYETGRNAESSQRPNPAPSRTANAGARPKPGAGESAPRQDTTGTGQDGQSEGATAEVAASAVTLTESNAKDQDLYGWRQPKNGKGYVYAIEKGGKSVGFLDLSILNDGTARIEDVVSTDGANSIGTKDVRALMRQVKQLHPGIKTFTGERVSGIRRGGKHGFSGTGEEVSVPAERKGAAALKANAAPELNTAEGATEAQDALSALLRKGGESGNDATLSDIIGVLRTLNVKRHQPVLDAIENSPMLNNMLFRFSNRGQMGPTYYSADKDSNKHAIVIDPDFIQAVIDGKPHTIGEKNPAAVISEVLTHELVHAATWRTLNGEQGAVLRARIERAMADLQKWKKDNAAEFMAMPAEGRRPINIMLGNVQEFATYSLTEKAAQEVLGKIPSSNGGSLLTEFVRAIKKALGIKGEISRLTDFIALSEEVIAAGYGKTKPDFDLAAQTETDLAEQAAAKAESDKAEAQAKRNAEQKEKADAERAFVRGQSEAAADTFELGGNAMDNLTGQSDAFGATPAVEAASKEAWELTRKEYVDQEIAANRYSDQYQKDPAARKAKEDQLEKKWKAELDKRAGDGRISDRSLDDLVAREGESGTNRFRGAKEKGVEGYRSPENRAEIEAADKAVAKAETAREKLRDDEDKANKRDDAEQKRLQRQNTKEQKARHREDANARNAESNAQTESKSDQEAPAAEVPATTRQARRRGRPELLTDLDRLAESAAALPIPVSPDDVPLQAAEDAYKGISYSPDDRAIQEQMEYLQEMISLHKSMSKLADTDEKKADLNAELARYKQGYLKRNSAILAAKGRTMSSMITGGANFPVARNQKRLDTEMKRIDEFLEWRKKAQASIRKTLSPELAAISSTDTDAISKLNTKLASLETAQERMKLANKIVKAKKPTDSEKVQQLQDEAELTERQARELLEPDFAGRIGFPAYALSNNNAEIRRVKQRIQGLEARKETAEAVGGTITATFDGGTVEADYEAGYVRVMHTEKPSAEVRQELKSSGFRWAPSEGAWRRKLSNQAIYKAEQITGAKIADSDAPMFSRKAQTETAAFKEWFGDSKVVDEQGAPSLPWMMTASEWNAERERVRPNVAQSKFTGSSKSEAVSRSERLEALTYGVASEAQAEIQAAQEEGASIDPDRLDDLMEQINTPATHKRVIEKALKEGLPVPARVMADYPELSTGPDQEAQSGQQPMFSRAGERNLFVAHNLSEKNLQHVLEIGGLAAPSLAVGRTDKGGFGDFGEITLLAPSSILESDNARTFDADIYTPRHPQAEYKIDHGAFLEQSRGMDNEFDLALPQMADVERNGMSDMARSPAYQYAWLKSKDKAPKAKQKKADPAIKKLAKLGLNRYELANSPKAMKIAEAHYREQYEAFVEVVGREDVRREELYFEEDGSLKFALAQDLMLKAEQYKNSGGIDIGQMKQDLSKKMRPKLVQRQYEKWIQEQFNEVNQGPRLFNGFTNAGNRRYKPYNLDVVVKEMTRELQGGESFNYASAGSVRASFATEMKRVNQVQANRDRIVSPEAMEQVKEESAAKLEQTLEALKPYYKFEADGFGYTSDASSAIAEGIKGQREAFNMDTQSRAIIKELTDYLRELPTAYFETKIGRAVDLSEFSVALVPKGTPAETVQALRDKGLTVKRYDAADPDSRSAEVARQEDLLFSREGFRRGPTQATPNLTAAQAETIKDELLKGWTAKPDIIIADRISEFPNKLRQAIREAGAESDMRGVLFENKVYILASRLPTRAAMEEVVLHEVVGHYGLRKLVGAELKPLLNQVYLNFAGTAKMKEVIRNYYPKGDFSASNVNHRLKVAEELLAHMAETGKHQKLWSKIVAAVRDAIRKMGFTLEMTEADLLGILAGAQRTVERGGISQPSSADLYSPANGAQDTAAMSRDGAQLVITPEQAKAEGYDLEDAFYAGTYGEPAQKISDLSEMTIPGGGDNFFGGIFASSTESLAESHGDTMQEFVTKNGTATNEDLNGDSRTDEILRKQWSQDSLTDEEFNELRDSITSGGSLFNSEIDESRLMEIFSGEDIGQADWYAQGVRGLLAKELGFDAVEMPDEHGMSYLLVGSGVRRIGSDAALSRTGQTNTPAFREWFGDSKVVDEGGAPVVVYHGTRADFSTFSSESFGDGVGGEARNGFFFTSDPDEASGYAAGSAPGGNVIPAYLSIKKPAEFTFSEHGISDIIEADEKVAAMMDGAQRFVSRLRGVDGLILRDIGGEGRDLYVAFQPSQIKSAIGNSGDFDSGNPDIRYSRAKSKKGTKALGDSIKAAISGVPELAGTNVIQSASDLPAKAQAEMKRKGVKPDTVRGLYMDGEIYVVADNIVNAEDGIRVAVHEAVGHKGIRGVLGEGIDNVMLSLYRSLPNTPQGREALAEVKREYSFLDTSKRSDRIQIAEEMVAHLLEKGIRPKAWQRAMSKIRELLRTLIPAIAWTYTDVLSLGEQSREYLRGRKAGTGDKALRYNLGSRERISGGNLFSDFNEADRTAAAKMGPRSAPRRVMDFWKEVTDNAALKIRQGMVDRLAGFKAQDEALLGDRMLKEDITRSSWVLGRMANAANGALNTMLHTGRLMMDPTEKVLTLKDDGSKGLGSVFAKLASHNDPDSASAEVQRFMGWIAGNRSRKLLNEGRENLFTEEEIGAMERWDRGALADGRNRAETYADVFAEFQAYRDDVLAIADQAGLLKKGMEEGDAILFMADKHGIRGDLVKRAKKARKDAKRADDVDVKEMAEAAEGKALADLQEAIETEIGTPEFDTEYGQLTTDQRELWANEFYVPFYRISEDDNKSSGQLATGGLSRQQAYKRLKGGTQNLNDLLENTMMNFHHLLDASLKNQAAQQAVENAKLLGMAHRVSESNRDAKNSTFVLEDGEQVFYQIDDPLVFQSLTALTTAGMNNPAMKIMRGFKRLFTNMTTITPQFMVANLIRDTLQAAATSEVDKNVFKNVISGTKSYNDEKVRAKMMAAGASFNFGHLYGSNPDELRAQLTRDMRGANLIDGPKAIPDALRDGWAWWNDVNNAAENVNRAAIFTQNEDQGKLKAAFESRDLMDFSAHGAWTAARILIDIVPFLNARIQGLDKIYRSGMKPGASVLKGLFGGDDPSVTDKQSAGRFWAVTGALAMATMALYLHNEDDEEYQKLENWQKDTYWFIRFGDQAYFIPKPFEVGAIATMVERITEQFVSDEATGKLFRERMLSMVTETFAFSPVPQAVQPLLDIYANYDAFRDRPIEGMGMDRLSPELRKRASTSKAGEWISQGLNATVGALGSQDTNPFALSPIQVDHLIGGYLGQVGTWVAGSGDVAWRVATGKEQPAQRWYEYQPIRRFYKSLGDEDRYTRYGSVFYEGLREAGRAHADVKELREAGRLADAAELAEDKQDILQLRLRLNRAQSDLRKINRRIDVVRKSGQDGELKRQQIDRMRAIKNQIQRFLGAQVLKAQS